DADDALLDLGHFEPSTVSTDEAILDIDLGLPTAPVYSPPVGTAAAFGVQPAVARETHHEFFATSEPEIGWSASATPVGWPAETSGESAPQPVVDHTPFAGQITAEQLSPELIDLIVRRVVQQISEKVVREIAWEVVPELAELHIKRRLEQPEEKR